MTARRPSRATQGLGSEHLLCPPDRALMPSWTISVDSVSSCHSGAHGQAVSSKNSKQQQQQNNNNPALKIGMFSNIRFSPGVLF